MHIDEFGSKGDKTLIMLHGAFFTNAFGRNIKLSRRYHLVMPHIMGFGEEAGRTFDTDEAIKELRDLAHQYESPAIIGFSLGAQLAYALLTLDPLLYSAGILVSPWLIGKDPFPEDVMEENLKMYHSLQSKTRCRLIGLMNGMPKKERDSFARNMQKVSEETVRRSADNGITLERYPRFDDVNCPVLALAGEKEADSVIASVYALRRENPLCVAEVWEGAGHNIPPRMHKEFDKRVVEFIG
jgi:pimeloyl-ACP methyl ester carboxylesterase